MRTALAKMMFAVGFLASLGGFMLLTAAPVHAYALIPLCARVSGTEPPGLDCALQTFESVARFIMGITGSVALLFFVYGGFMMLTAGGSADKVKQGTTIIRNAVIGIVLVLTAFYVVDYFTSALRGRETHSVGEACLNGQGKYTDVGGTPVCRYTCESVQGFQCVGTAGSGATCTDYVCPGTQICCQAQ